MTYLAGSTPAPVIFASPVSHPPSRRHSSRIPGPPARWMAPSTPPPPSRLEFAALTIASARASVVMSPRCRVIAPAIATVLYQLEVSAGGRPRGPAAESVAQGVIIDRTCHKRSLAGNAPP